MDSTAFLLACKKKKKSPSSTQFLGRDAMFQSHFLPEVIQVDGCFHITRERNDDGIYPLKPPYHPALLHVALKIPTPTQEPGLFIFGTKCQKVASLEASELFAFLQLYYLSLPS